VRVEFLILDERGAPIPHASVQLVGDRSSQAALTALDGRAAFDLRASAGGRFSFFRRTRYVHYRDWDLLIDADDFGEFLGNLGDLTADTRYHAKGVVPPPIAIRLGKRPETM
jgi:hypothetical protein